MYNHTINNVNEIKAFFRFLIEYKSLNFHPDTDFGEYISVESEEATFNCQETAHYNTGKKQVGYLRQRELLSGTQIEAA